MTLKYNNVYINETGTVTGPYESNGPLSKHFDKSYNDFYFGMKTWETAESKLITEAVDIMLNKAGKTKFDADVFISGDLLNQVAASNYAAASLGIPYMGIYSACSTSTLGLIIGANMIESKQIKSAITCASSHTNAAEKQFRYPVEYGGPKPKTATFTSTGAACALLTNNKKGIKIESSTIGTVVDLGVKDVYHMGAVMAPSAAQTIFEHLRDTKREIGYYDLIITGDLGVYGKEILIDYLKTEYNINLNNCDDAGVLLYDRDHQPVYAGASGPATCPLVTYSYIFNRMYKKDLRRVLMVATGALHSPSMVNSKNSIPSVSHAVSLEVVE